jgi:hypothetical protein
MEFHYKVQSLQEGTYYNENAGKKKGKMENWATKYKQQYKL